MVSGCLWPGDDSPWCYPRSLASDIESRFGRYQADVEDFRTEDPARIYQDIRAMTRQHFDIATWIWADKQPDFMMMVEIGLDRFHHAFWRHIDPHHPLHELGNPWADTGRAYYALLDEQIGKLRQLAGPETTFVIVSDHGAQAMRGGFCINEWLIRRGYLVLVDKKEPPRSPGVLMHDAIDWTRTVAWAEGGYYARLFLNVAGREPHGKLSPTEARRLLERLRAELDGLTDDEGRPIATLVRDPGRYYRRARGFPPDLMVYFDSLALRAIGSVGHGRLVVDRNDTGDDSCNHDWNGIFVMSGGRAPARGEIRGAEIYDVAPTILSLFGIERPPGVFGRDWCVY
jgi:predicted AlkP superfamily phosphohydrolase/phosphomutase